jgi:hypothetical protein
MPLSLAMRTWIFTKTFRFVLGNVLTFHLDAIAQSLFPGSKDRFELGLPVKVSDRLITKRHSYVDPNCCLVKASIGFTNR